MNNDTFDFHGRCTEHDCETAAQYLGSLYRPPDLVIAPAGHGEYIFRWYVVPRNREGNVYFHVQTQSDPERPLHDHPWDNTSIILAGGYHEIIDTEPEANSPACRAVIDRNVGDVIHRPATWAHRLILPKRIPYSMSLFVTGPKVREWGFWENGTFAPFNEITIETDGKSQWKPTGGMA